MKRVAAALAGIAIVIGLALVPSTAAHADFVPANNLWVTTSTQTIVYERNGATLTVVSAVDNAPTGTPVYNALDDRVYVPTADGARAMDASVGESGELITPPFPVSGYKQAELSADGTVLYLLRSDGTVIDAFNTESESYVQSFDIGGAATSISPPHPTLPIIVVNSYLPTSSSVYASAVLTTTTGALAPFNTTSTMSVPQSVWSPDGDYLFMAMAGTTSAAGAVGRFDPQTQVLEQFSIGADLSPQAITLSADGTLVYLPSTGVGGSDGIYSVDTTTMSVVGSPIPGAADPGWGAPAATRDSWLYAPGGGAGFGFIGTYDLALGGFGETTTSDRVFGVLALDRPAQVVPSGSGQTTLIETVFAEPTSVEVRDVNGVPLAGVPVRFSIVDGNAVFLSPESSGYTDSDGVFAAPLIRVGGTPGVVTVQAVVLTLPAVEFTLNVEARVPPQAPTITALDPGDGALAVSFTPGESGNRPTTGYRVTATDITDPSRGGQTAEGSGSPITVSGLTNGDTYTVTVTALSEAGDATSPASERITVGIPASITGTPPQGTVGVPYEFTFVVVGTPTPVVELNPGTPLPSGLTFDPATATISGTPEEAGSTFLFITAENALAQAQAGPTLVIGERPVSEVRPDPTKPEAPSSVPPTSPAGLAATGVVVSGSVALGVALLAAGFAIFGGHRRATASARRP